VGIHLYNNLHNSETDENSIEQIKIERSISSTATVDGQNEKLTLQKSKT
jgi:hypothetical protein